MNRKDRLKEAFAVASNKDVQLTEDMGQINKTRKKTKELLKEERKKLLELNEIPEKNKLVYLFLIVWPNYINCFIPFQAFVVRFTVNN